MAPPIVLHPVNADEANGRAMDLRDPERPLHGKPDDRADRPEMAGSSPSTLTFQSRVKTPEQSLGSSSPTPGPDPDESLELPGSRRSFVLELTFDAVSAATPTVLVNFAA